MEALMCRDFKLLAGSSSFKARRVIVCGREFGSSPLSGVFHTECCHPRNANGCLGPLIHDVLMRGGRK